MSTKKYSFLNINKNRNINKAEFLGRLSDSDLYKEYAKAKALIALAKDEDFGMTVVEAQAAGTPVIAFNGGGFKESVIDGVTGVLINEISDKSLTGAINKIKKTKWDKEKIIANAKRFSKERFIVQMKEFVFKYAGTS
jgi:glycosyltransferase involved in cell wall biosynthesis